MKQRNQPGYILAVTLGMIGLCMFISVYIFNKGFVFARFSQTMVEREKARQLAYGGLQLAISQLAAVQKKEEASNSGRTQDDKKSAPTLSDGAFLLQTILPLLNKPQKFILKQPVDGINGTIGLVIGAEEGKININRAYDFEKHAFIGEGQPNGDMKKVFQDLFGLIKDTLNADLFADFERFLKERKYPLNDVTELLKIKGFDAFKANVFIDPFVQRRPEAIKIYLSDIFTVSSSKKEIDPWLFSDSLQTLLKLKQTKESAPALEELLKKFKEQADWKKDWNTVLQPLYGVEFNALPPSIAGIFNPSFAPKMFWVLAQGTVGKITVSILAFLERTRGASADVAPVVKIRNVYLL